MLFVCQIAVIIASAAVVIFITLRRPGYLWIAVAIVAGALVSFFIEWLWMFVMMNGATVEEVKPYATVVFKGIAGIALGLYVARHWRRRTQMKKRSDAA